MLGQKCLRDLPSRDIIKRNASHYRDKERAREESLQLTFNYTLPPSLYVCLSAQLCTSVHLPPENRQWASTSAEISYLSFAYVHPMYIEPRGCGDDVPAVGGDLL